MLGLLHFSHSQAQSSADSSFRQIAIKNTISTYHRFLGKEASLYNGPEYQPYLIRLKDNHPYFKVDSLAAGYVLYDGLDYSDVFMKYDLVRDELVILHHDGFHKINLIKEKIDGFTLFNHRFIKLEPDTVAKVQMAAGFYDLLHDGSVKLLARRAKSLQETISGLTVEYIVETKNRYYLLKQGVYYPVKNKRSLFDQLKDKKSSLQHFIKTNNIRFKKNFEAAATAVVAQYDQITK